jgi:Mn-dependent DtxR family transcriptional regulator
LTKSPQLYILGISDRHGYIRAIYIGCIMDNRFLEDPREKKYQIERLWEHHGQIIRLLVASNGKFTNKEIAAEVGCSPQTVSNVRNNPLAQSEIRSLMGQANDNAVDVAKEIRDLFPIAANVLKNTMKMAETEVDVACIDPKILSQSVRSAITIIDHTHPRQVAGTILHNHMSLAEIMDIKEQVDAQISNVQEANIIEERAE